MNKQKLLKKTTSWIIAFVCSVTLSMCCILFCLYLTLFNEKFMLQIIQQTNYSQTLTDEINLSFTDLSRASNIPPSVVKNSLSSKDIEQNVEQYIHAIYHGENFQLFGETQLKNTLHRKILAYAQSKKIAIDKNSQEAINTFINQAN